MLEIARNRQLFGSSCLVLMACLSSQAAHAALEARYLDGSTTANAYYDTALNITWLADADLAATQTFGVSGIDESPSVAGRMNDATAKQWIAAMNKADYLGQNDWALPSTTPLNGTSFQVSSSNNGTTDFGYNLSAPGTPNAGTGVSQLAYLYYNDLGNIAAYTPSGASNSLSSFNSGPFTNIKFTYGMYWSGATVVYAGKTYGVGFYMYGGNEGLFDPTSVDYYTGNYAWAVLPGDAGASVTSPVPESGAASTAMAALGVLLLGARLRRSRAPSLAA